MIVTALPLCAVGLNANNCCLSSRYKILESPIISVKESFIMKIAIRLNNSDNPAMPALVLYLFDRATFPEHFMPQPNPSHHQMYHP